jgi:predicted O-methyltransferase YrrM
MPHAEGLALYAAALDAPTGPLLEVGSYCGKSAVYLGAAARDRGTLLYSIDHHGGSEEHQAGQEYFDERLLDAKTGLVDSLPFFKATIAAAGLENVVVGIVGRSEIISAEWKTALALVFIDGGHSEAAVRADYRGWAPHLGVGGMLVFHDVFEDAAEGGQAPFHVYREALASGAFTPRGGEGSLRVLERVGHGL